MDLLLPELLLMASLSLLLAFFLGRLISVTATTPTPSSSEDDHPLVPASTVDQAAAVGTGRPGEAGEGESGERREEDKRWEEQQKELSSAAPSVAGDDEVDDGGLSREVEIVGTEEQEGTELLGLSSDDTTGVVDPEYHGEQGEETGFREVHVTSALEALQEGKPKVSVPTEEVAVGTATAIAIAPSREGLQSDDFPVADPDPRTEAETQGTAVPVRLVESAAVPEETGPSDADADDDWEGIEASELGKLFAVAVSFVASPAGVDAVSKLPSDVQLQLHGLHKAATEGPCFEAQPMPLKIAARAKWNAWQKLGDMNPEIAMERYITILSAKVPGWMENKPIKQERMQWKPSDSTEQSQPLIETERKTGLN